MPITSNLSESGEAHSVDYTGVASPPTARERYRDLMAIREPFLQRAREACKFTLPSLLPDRGASGSTDLPSPPNGFGAYAVNNIAAKTCAVLLPPDSPFFTVEPERPPETDDETWSAIKNEVSSQMQQIEKRVMDSINTRMIRADSITAMKHLYVCGNVCIKCTDGLNDRVILYPLSSYVCKRDSRGHILELILSESVASQSLSDDIRALCKINATEGTYGANNEQLVMYTVIYLNPRKSENSPYTYTEFKELNGVKLPGTEKTHKSERKLPYLVLRFETTSGEDYGRGLVEQYQGDFIFINDTTEDLKDAADTCAQLRWLVNPNGNTDIEALTNSKNGEFVSGDPRDVVPLTVGKNADLQFADGSIRVVEQRLSQAFLLTQSLRRDAERVTAYEIQTMRQELETSLGGVYSTLSQEFQVPLLENLFSSLNANKLIPTDIDVGSDKGITVQIITGISDLGRGTDLQRFTTFLGMLAQFAPQDFAKALNFPYLVQQLARTLGIQSNDLVKSQAQLDQEQQQAMAMQAGMGMLQQAASPEMLAQAQAMGGAPQSQQPMMMQQPSPM